MEKLLILFLWINLLLISKVTNELDSFIETELRNCNCAGEVIIVVASDSPHFDFNKNLPLVFSSRKIIFLHEGGKNDKMNNSYLVHNNEIVSLLKGIMKTNGPFLIEYSSKKTKMIVDLSKLK